MPDLLDTAQLVEDMYELDYAHLVPVACYLRAALNFCAKFLEAPIHISLHNGAALYLIIASLQAAAGEVVKFCGTKRSQLPQPLRKYGKLAPSRALLWGVHRLSWLFVRLSEIGPEELPSPDTIPRGELNDALTVRLEELAQGIQYHLYFSPAADETMPGRRVESECFTPQTPSLI